MSIRKKKRKDKLVTLSSTRIEVTSFNEMDSQILNAMHRSMLWAMVTDILRTLKVIMTIVGAVLAVEKVERRDCENNNGISNCA
jgi:hypothetical protein